MKAKQVIAGTVVALAGVCGYLLAPIALPNRRGGGAIIVPPHASAAPSGASTTGVASSPERDPGGAAAKLEGLDAGGEEDLVRLTAETQRALTSGRPNEIERALTQLVPALVRLSPPTAAALVESLPDSELRADGLDLVSRLWAGADPAAAVQWAANLARPDDREVTLDGVTAEIAVDHPDEAVRVRAGLLGKGDTHASLEALLQRWAEKDFNGAASWVSQAERSPQRDALTARLAFVAAATAPRDAAILATTQIAPGSVQDEAVIAVLHQWAQRDAVAAGNWVRQYSESDLRARAIAELAVVARYSPVAGR